jgi:hypothetical protein
MKRRTIILATGTVALYLCSLTAFAQHGTGGHGGGGGHSAATDGQGSSHDGTKSGGDSGKGTHAQGKSVTDHLQDNTKLASKLQNLLGLSGANAVSELQTDAQGFKNLGQFVSAVHVSKNLDIPFDQLKSKMAGPPAESLGKAIHDLKPDASSKSAVKQARSEARKDIKESES